MPTFTVDGNSASYTVREEDVTVFASGSWGGGTLNVQTYGDDDAWHTVSSATANTYAEFKNKGGTLWRLNLASSTTPSLWYEVR